MSTELEQLGERIAEHAAHLDAAIHRLLTDLRDFDQRGGWHVQGARSCAHWLSWRVGWDLVTARERVRVANRLGELPALDDALRRGALSYSKVRAMVRVATPENEALLLGYAELMPAAQLEKLSRKYALVQRHGDESSPLADTRRRWVRRRDTDDGMVQLEARLHPDEAELVWAMLDHRAAQLARGDSAESNTTRITSTTATSTTGASTIATSTIATLGGCEGRDTPADSAESGHALAVLLPTEGSADTTRTCNTPATGTTRTIGTLGRCDHNTPADSAESNQAVAALPISEADDPIAGYEYASSHDHSAESSHESQVATRVAELVDGPTIACVGHAAPPRSALAQREAETTRAFNRADALVSVAQAFLRGDRWNRAPIDVVVTVAASALAGSSHASAPRTPTPTDGAGDVAELGQSYLSRNAARRVTCDAGVVEIIESDQGIPLSVGRKHRTLPGALKRALVQRDRTCTFPGCDHRLFLEGHHLHHWADGGETSLSNTLLLCDWHHRHVHEYGYSIEVAADGRRQFRDPNGRVVPASPRPQPALPPERLGWPAILAANADLAITADTASCRWDGRPVHYGAPVSHLAAADDAARRG